MVHEKYIKRGSKVFGPYLYQNYRENGITKTKYLGKGDSGKNRKKLRVNLFIIFIIFLLILFFSFSGLFLFEKEKFIEKSSDFLEGLASLSPIDLLIKLFTTISPVNVFVKVIANTPPEILNVSEEILVCENTALDYHFFVKDNDGAEGLYVSISPLNPFYTEKIRNISSILAEYKIWSGVLGKNYVNDKRAGNNGWADYSETIDAYDLIEHTLFSTKITIIEVNNAPKFNIGTETIELYIKGDNNIFYYDLGSELRGKGEETPTENLTFNLTFLNGTAFFNISKQGIINVMGNESFIEAGENSTTYNLRLCVNDTGLDMREAIHPNISICLNATPPQSADALSFCDNFTLTVTKKNRKPEITSYWPLNLSLNVSGGILYFNITARDPDWNPVDVYWYVDNVEEKYEEAVYENNLSEFEFVFGCEISGEHNASVVVTDGLLNNSLQWNLSVKYTECPKPQPPGIGGGGIGKLYCKEKWGCNDWMQCGNLNKLVEEGWTSKETELLIKERCRVLNYTEEFCGFQTRICVDYNYCKTEFYKPPFLRECYYTENPNCTDGIKNCHDGACEVLVDCGGPCVLCPTCNDKIKNQNEERVDCGGICKPCVELPFKPLLFKSIVMYSLIALFILVLVLVIKQTIEYYKSKKRAEKESIKKIIKEGKKQEKTFFYKLIFIIFIALLLFFANIYITRITNLDVISGISKIGEGVLASYNFISNFFRSLGIFLAGGPFVSGDTKLVIWDDTDTNIRKSGWNTFFYANYTNTTTNEPLSGSCLIRFEDYLGDYSSWETMVYDGVSTFKYNRTFNYKGAYNFEVNCSISSSSINGSDKFTITNSIPIIMEESGGGWINFDGNPMGRDAWQCIEDIVCYYNFSANVTDPDINDILTYSYGTENTTLTNYFLNETTGMLTINITLSDYAKQDRRIELKVQDSDRELWRSALLEVDIQEVNDAPQFVNLTDKTFNEGDLFEYIIDIYDEENNVPFKFNISFVSCDNFVSRGNCTLFTPSFDEMQGKINISFIPSTIDIGNYIINFSVMDNSSLGNKTTSVLVNFTVTPALWNNTARLDYLLLEDENNFINLTENILDGYKANVNFSYNLINSNFPSLNSSSFNLATGVINITPSDKDVGENFVKIIASSLGIFSSRIFNFTILNINDNVSIVRSAFSVNGANQTGLDIKGFENANITFTLFADDDDFKIPQKSFYDENLSLNLTIEGPNSTLFSFVYSGLILNNRAMYTSSFIPRNASIGNYNITINISDKNNSSDVFRFNLTIMSRNYNTPNITYPDESAEFNMKENVTSNLIFRANHSVGDALNYSFYINNILRDSFLASGNDTNVTWSFAPNFTDETYENEIKELTLKVKNPYYSDLYTNRSWNLTINHTNAPPELIRDIGDKSTTYNNRIEIDLQNHFTDIDYYDVHYNQSFVFNVSAQAVNGSSNIGWIKDSEWKIILIPLTQRYTKEVLRVIMHDLNGTGILNNVSSNNFTIEFTEPTTIQVPVPTSGSSQTIPISLKIIMPGQISAYEYEKIEIPISLINTGKNDFNDLTLSSSAFKDGNITKEVNTSLDKYFFKTLKPNQKENLTLTVYFNTDKIGDYEVLVNVTSKSPVYTDWGKIHINLQKINESQIREIIVFTQEFIVKNPECIEIQEIVKEAEKLFEQGDYANAKLKSEEAVNACKESISQVSVPKKKIKSFEISLYLVLSILLAFIVGIAYYFLKRRRLQKALFKKESLERK